MLHNSLIFDPIQYTLYLVVMSILENPFLLYFALFAVFAQSMKFLFDLGASRLMVFLAGGMFVFGKYCLEIGTPVFILISGVLYSVSLALIVRYMFSRRFFEDCVNLLEEISA